MKLFGSILLLVVVGCLVSALAKRFEDKPEMMAIKALVAGVAVAVTRYFATDGHIVVVIVLYLAMLALMAYAAIWWAEDGSTIKEMVLLSLADLFVMMMALTCADRFIDYAPWWAAGILKGVPGAAFVLSLGFFIANMLWFKDSLKIDEALEGGGLI